MKRHLAFCLGPALRCGALSFVFLAATSVAAAAGAFEDSIVSQLRNQGFRDIDVSRTLLGRSRIVGQSDDLVREIIVNRTTGEILRDYWERKGGGKGPGIVNPESHSSSGGHSYGDDRDDDRGDDGDDGGRDRGRGGDDNRGDDSSDNSGSGGGGDDNSGSGGGDDDD
jgi:hypothetical protein